MKFANNLINLDDKKEQLEFEKTEAGVDCTFNDLPVAAQRIAIDIIEKHKEYNLVKRAIDRSIEFKQALGIASGNFYLKETDSVMRWWAYNYDKNGGLQ
jgi:hypothetical protein